MPISNVIKGLQSIKSMQNVVKSSISNKEDSNFIKLYLFEKERSRLQSEEIRIMLRLEIIQNRLKEIREYSTDQIAKMHLTEPGETSPKKADKPNSGFKTISIDY